MTEKQLSELADRDFPDFEIRNDEDRQQVINNAKYFRGSVRISTGRFWAQEEYEERRNKVLKMKLP